MSDMDRDRTHAVADFAPSPEPLIPDPPAALWLAGSSAAITQLRAQIRRVAPHFRTALFVGEPGCGEAATAEFLHQLSPLRQRPFVHLNSPQAFSLFNQAGPQDALAATGMFYISRPDLLLHPVQSRLLGLLRRYGPQAPRIVVFAERGLRPLVSSSVFSTELAESLGALRIAIPALRERRDDVPELLSNLLNHLAKQSGAARRQLAPDLMDAARMLPWPGNLLQLYAAAQGLMQCANQHLHASDLDAVLASTAQPAIPSSPKVRLIRLEDVIQEHIRSVLLACNGNKLRTAGALGISRSTLYRMLDSPERPCSPSSLFTSVDSSHLHMAG